VAVIANGPPIWLQDSAWSRALRRFLEVRFDSDLSASCCTDEWRFGNLMSAMPVEWLPARGLRQGPDGSVLVGRK